MATQRGWMNAIAATAPGVWVMGVPERAEERFEGGLRQRSGTRQPCTRLVRR